MELLHILLANPKTRLFHWIFYFFKHLAGQRVVPEPIEKQQH